VELFTSVADMDDTCLLTSTKMGSAPTISLLASATQYGRKATASAPR